MEQADGLADFIMNGEFSNSSKKNDKTFNNTDKIYNRKAIFPVYNLTSMQEVVLLEMNKNISEIHKEDILGIDNINIYIENLKSISSLQWNIKYTKGIHVIISENGSGKSSLVISLAKLIQPSVLANEFIGKGFEHSLIKYTINHKSYSWKKPRIWSQENSSVPMPKIEGFF